MLKGISFFKKYLNKRYLLKLILSYVIFAMAFVIIVTIVLYKKSNDIISDEVGKSVNDIVLDNSYVISEIMNDVRTAYFQELQSTIVNDFLEDNYLLCRTYDESKGVQRVIDICNGVIRANKYIESIYIYDESIGKILANDSHRWTYEEINYEAWTRQKFSSDMPVFSASRQTDNSIPPRERLFYSYIGGFPLIVNGKDRILINLNIDAINDRLNKIGIRESGFIFVTEKSGRILFHKNKEMHLTHFQMNYGKTDISASESGNFVYEMGGRETLIVYKTISGLDWKVIALIPLNEINNPIEVVRNIAFITCLISLGIAVIFSLLFSKKIYGPLNVLVAEMKKVETGDLEVKVIHHRKDEFGYLFDRFNRMMEKIKTLIINTFKLELANKESQLKTLQAQINPHFLYNTLNTLFCMAKDSGNDVLADTISKLSEYYRICLSDGEEEIPVKEVVRQLICYYEIEKVKRPGKFELDIQVDSDAGSCKMLKMLLQPIVENSFIHGTDPSKEMLKVIVRGSLDKDEIRFEITDNGRGIKPEQLEQIKDSLAGGSAGDRHFALSNVNNRIKLFYGDKYGIQLDSELNKGTRVIIIISVHGNSKPAVPQLWNLK